MKGLCNAYRDRRRRKRIPSPLDCPYHRRSSPEWRELQPSMGGLKKADVRLNRKMLAHRVADPGSFTNVVAAAKS